MTWTIPATPLSGTAITVAFYVANIKDNLNHLRSMVPDAGGAGQVLNSSSSTVAAWTASPSITNLTIATQLTLGSITAAGSSLTFHVTGDLQAHRAASSTTGYLILGNSTSHYIGYDGSKHVMDGFTSWHAGNDGAGSGLDADTVDGVQEAALAKLASANFTTLQRGGSDVLTMATGARSAANTYTGDGGTTGRQITVGFVPKIVWLWDQTTGSSMYICMYTGGSIRLHNGGNPEFTSEVKLHGSDGFIVGDGANHRGNDVSEAYRWVAMI